MPRPIHDRVPQRRSACRLATALVVAGWPIIARADEGPQAGASVAAGATGSGAAQGQGGKPAWSGDLGTRANLLGDIGGLRPTLDAHGVAFGLNETTEVLGNATGGVRRGAVVEGLTQMSVGVDTQKAFGWAGGIFNVSAYQIHGRGLTTGNLHTLNLASTIEADPATLLNELWFQQSFWGGKLDIKVGQQSADLEFITSEYEDLFINSGFGWPTLPSVDLPSGGPAYPLATPGIRLRARPDDQLTVLLGLFNGSPAGLKPGDPQRNDPSGTNFDVSSGALVIGEIQYGVNRETDAKGLPGTYKLGAWYDTNRFADASYLNNGTAQPPGVLLGIPRARRGDVSVYATIDQLVYRSKPDSDGGLGITARAMGSPDDRNIVDVFAQGGVTYKGAFGRDSDTMGVGVEWAHVGARARAGDAAANAAGTFTPGRTSETVIEATYQAQVYPWWQLQPDFQYVVRPGGGLADPNHPGRVIGDAAVFGLRSVVTF